MSGVSAALIDSTLRAAISPLQSLEVINESHLHAGHAGAGEGSHIGWPELIGAQIDRQQRGADHDADPPDRSEARAGDLELPSGHSERARLARVLGGADNRARSRKHGRSHTPPEFLRAGEAQPVLAAEVIGDSGDVRPGLGCQLANRGGGEALLPEEPQPGVDQRAASALGGRERGFDHRGVIIKRLI